MHCTDLLLGEVVRGRAGHKAFLAHHYETAKGRDKCRLIQNEFQIAVDVGSKKHE